MSRGLHERAFSSWARRSSSNCSSTEWGTMFSVMVLADHVEAVLSPVWVGAPRGDVAMNAGVRAVQFYMTSGGGDYPNVSRLASDDGFGVKGGPSMMPAAWPLFIRLRNGPRARDTAASCQ